MNHQLVKEMAQILYDKKAQDIVALDVTGLTVITDCMLIASGRNTLQVRTLAEDLQERFRRLCQMILLVCTKRTWNMYLVKEHVMS